VKLQLRYLLQSTNFRESEVAVTIGGHVTGLAGETHPGIWAVLPFVVGLVYWFAPITLSCDHAGLSHRETDYKSSARSSGASI